MNQRSVPIFHAYSFPGNFIVLYHSGIMKGQNTTIFKSSF